MTNLLRVCALSVLVSSGVAGLASAQTTTRVSVSATGAQAMDFSQLPEISADGRYVAFYSFAANLVAGDTNARADIFVKDRQTGAVDRVSVASDGSQANGNSLNQSISGDGRFVVFESTASNLVPGDTNNREDVFVRDRQTATTTRVSVSTSGAQGTGFSGNPTISANGRYVAFRSSSPTMVANDTNGEIDVFLRDLEAKTTVNISVASNGVQANRYSLLASLSADGQIVAFTSPATNLVPGDTNDTDDIFVRDVTQGTTTRVSVSSTGAQANGSSNGQAMSADGRFVAFTSFSFSLIPSGGWGLYIHDRQSRTTSALSLIAFGNDPNVVPGGAALSSDGSALCYSQRMASGLYETFLMDRQTLAITTVGVAMNGAAGNNTSFRCAISGDGRLIAFESMATNLVPGDTNAQADIFVRAFPSSMAVDKTALTFAAASNGAAFVSQTASQIVRLTQEGSEPVTWTAASTQPWLQVTPSSGAGSGVLSVSVLPTPGLPASGKVTGTVVFLLTGAANTLSPISVSLTLVPSATSVGPFGTVDTPADNRTGVTGAIPFTGWALDDIEVTRVSLCRAAFGAEIASPDPNCGGAAEIFVGFAVFIDGARPDVAAAFTAHPLSTRGGWGFMVLTNMLPAQGNGTYTFRARAFDREGNVFLLGTRTITCANASATLPFGTLDTPLQGDVVSGSSYINFGWALTPLPKTIPFDGSTIHVLVDGVRVGNADYNHLRPDIQALFPGFNNTNGAVGFRIFDTTTLANGLHTISWTVMDNQGAIDGIGSRFFTVSNGVAAVTAAASSATSTNIEALPLDATPLAGRRGWDLEAPYGWFGAGANGMTVIRSEEVNRIELQLGDGDHTGYLRTPAGLAPLPIGSRLDPATKTFTWAPGVGFVGRYDFVFVRSLGGRTISRRDIRIVLHPKGRGAVGPQVVVDVPAADAAVHQPFMIGGWAIDLDAPEGTGVTTLHAWAFPVAGGAPIFLGATAYGGARPDVAAVHGPHFKESGFGLIAQGLPAGDYDLAIFAWSTEAMAFIAPKIVRVRVIP
jgi:hypothetical protein